MPVRKVSGCGLAWPEAALRREIRDWMEPPFTEMVMTGISLSEEKYLDFSFV